MNLKNMRIWKKAAEKRADRQKKYFLGFALFLIGVILKVNNGLFSEDTGLKKLGMTNPEKIEKVESGIKMIKL